jgi:hypothetical protein
MNVNERIRELAEQARKHFPKTEMSGEYWVFDEEKFAELIVEECKDLLFESSENNRLPIAVDDMVHIIDTHFGVEE